MIIFYSNKFLLHSLGEGHPESPERLKVIKRELENLNCNFVEPKDISEEELYLVHDKKYIERLKQLSESGGIFPDNVFSKDTFKIAKLAAAAVKEAALNCEKEFSFALVRPPGHHAGKNTFGGFCYINNIAFGIRSLQRIKRVKKVMLLDFDYHMGNGTWDIFYNDNSVFYLSFHCNPAFAYPGTGFEDENTDHMVNVVMNPNVSDKEYLIKFEENVKEYFKKFKPEVIAVSAGFDSYFKDPIAGLQIKNTETYKEIGSIIFSLKKPTFSTLEGGYYLPKLGEMVKNFIEAFSQ